MRPGFPLTIAFYFHFLFYHSKLFKSSLVTSKELEDQSIGHHLVQVKK